MNQQLPLWEDLLPSEVHHFIEVIYFGGKREIHDTACPECLKLARDMSIWSAQFVEKDITGCCHQRNSTAQGR
jgi:hypothetical protein